MTAFKLMGKGKNHGVDAEPEAVFGHDREAVRPDLLVPHKAVRAVNNRRAALYVYAFQIRGRKTGTGKLDFLGVGDLLYRVE